ncbi:hypothetical protein CBR_g39139 [Chara braunii]|uniref:Reverse transcriptase domain-containing protein n=1 Tax=Chara braunii TaxID=69332 RepID=A0A388LRE1_CHABU|nr:hypothetical protein CBR_g39139 [Chara braunii]|eukprot:GBG84762.1 hypothetical protein CBR_g39139 [Chara braunii]
MSGQLANEFIAECRQQFQAQHALIEAEEQRQMAVEAARLQAEAEAAAEKQRLQAEAEADAQALRKEAQALLQRHKAASVDKLKFWLFEPSKGHDDATPEEQHKEFLSKLVTRLFYTCNHLQSKFEKQHQEMAKQHQDLENLRRVVRNHKDLHEGATWALDSRVQDLEQAAPRPDAGEPSSAASTRQLEQQVDHVIEMLADISPFAAPATISEQLDVLKNEVRQLQQPDNEGSTSTQEYKMSIFRIEKFDDYTHQDSVPWWEGFTTKLWIHHVPKRSYIGALFLDIKGGCQIWLSHLATIHDIEVADPHTKISWADLTTQWKKRFIVDDAPTFTINRLFSTTQGNTPTRDWLTEWQKIVATPDLDLPFPHLRREFYNRLCAALSLALGDREQYTTFAEIIDKAREIIKTNSTVAHEKSAWQPAHVEKGKFGPRPQHVVAVQLDIVAEDSATTQASRDGDQVAAVQPRSNNNSCGKGRAKTASPTRNGQPVPWVKFHLIEAEYKWRNRMPLPPTDRLPKPHCNVLMAQLRDYLHTAIPDPLMDAGVEVVDLHDHVAKIDREFKTERYDDIDVPLPLLYTRIQIGEATCSALIDCGATRNYMSQDFMVHASLGPRVRRKLQPTQVTLADGHTHKSIDRCVDSVPVYFAPHASEAVSFDILDTQFDMILGMSWLRSEDQPMNFYRRTVHVHDRNGVLVPCIVPPPHPSISCHVVSAASIRASITRDDIEEMGVCFLHALPPNDIPLTDSSPDPRITELLDAYSEVFEAPHKVVPDRPIRHEIILEAGAVPPRGYIYCMSEEELSVLQAQLDDLLAKGWIRPSSSPYGAPVLLVRKKNKDLRLHIDYRKLNAQNVKNTGPLPRIGDLLNLDDILVYSRCLDGHVEHMRTVLERLRQAKYKANRDKCEFARQELEYLGHYVHRKTSVRLRTRSRPSAYGPSGRAHQHHGRSLIHGIGGLLSTLHHR